MDDEMSPAYLARWGNYTTVILYRLRVVETFKGLPGPTINFFEEVSSGAFYVDIGEEYLLFFNYHRPYPGRGSAARGTVRVRYACGQSKAWGKVKPVDLNRVRLLSARH